MPFGEIGAKTAFFGKYATTGGRRPGYTRTFQTPAQVRAATRITTPAAPAAAPAAGGISAEALAALGRAKAQYAPGGGFGKGIEAGLERGRVKAVSAGMQNLVGAGLAGTTMAGGLGMRYEEEVAAPTRMGVEEQRAQAVSGIEMAEAGMGFQAGQAGLQRGFQAGESAAQRSLQQYIANLQASLQRESTARRDRPTVSMTAPTGGGYARQFPSIYGQAGQQAPSLMGGADTADTPWPTPAQGFWGGSEQWRSEQPAWVTG